MGAAPKPEAAYFDLMCQTRLPAAAVVLAATAATLLLSLPTALAARRTSLPTASACEPVTDVRMDAGQNWTVVSWDYAGPAPERGYRVLVGPRGFFDPVSDPPIAEALVGADARRNVVIWDLEPGEAYDFYVQAVCSDTESSAFVRPTQNFTQEPAGTPANNSFTGDNQAQILSAVSVGCNGQPGSTRFATASFVEPSPCTASGPDVWYELNFVADRYTVEVAAANETTADLSLEGFTYEFDGSNEIAPQLVACANDTRTGGPESITVSADDLVEVNGRSRMLIRVTASDRAAPGDFLICAYQDTSTSSLTEIAPEAHLGIAPNPATSHVRVTLSQNPAHTPQPHRVRLLDATGRTVRTVLAQAAQPQVSLDVEALPSGVYVLRAEGTRDGSAASARVLIP